MTENLAPLIVSHTIPDNNLFKHYCYFRDVLLPSKLFACALIFETNSTIEGFNAMLEQLYYKFHGLYCIRIATFDIDVFIAMCVREY